MVLNFIEATLAVYLKEKWPRYRRRNHNDCSIATNISLAYDVNYRNLSENRQTLVFVSCYLSIYSYHFSADLGLLERQELTPSVTKRNTPNI